MSLRTLSIIFIATILSSCATIVGGSCYYAHVSVHGHPRAEIGYKGRVVGLGNATFKVRRTQANKMLLTVREGDCPEQRFFFTHKKFRGWAFAGSILFFTYTAGTVPLPFGVALDLMTGACFKPDIRENGVGMMNFKHFTYELNYESCQDEKPVQEKTKFDRLKEMMLLLKEGVISPEEFDKEKKKIMDEK